MAGFDSCVNAVECALSLHEELTASNANRPPERRMVLRMGLHIGEPLEDDVGLYGAAVVVAARLCDLAGTGQLLVSDVVRTLLEPRRAYAIVDVGPRWLKGFPQPMVCHVVGRLRGSAARHVDGADRLGRRRARWLERRARPARASPTSRRARRRAMTVVVHGEHGADPGHLVAAFAAEAGRVGAEVVWGHGADGVPVLAAALSAAQARPGRRRSASSTRSLDAGVVGEIAALVAGRPEGRVLAVAVTHLPEHEVRTPAPNVVTIRVGGDHAVAASLAQRTERAGAATRDRRRDRRSERRAGRRAAGDGGGDVGSAGLARRSRRRPPGSSPRSSRTRVSSPTGSPMGRGSAVATG